MIMLSVFLCLGVYMVEGIQGQRFPCDFNIYENLRDGRITAEEFFAYSKKHDLDSEQSKLVFGIFDSNGDDQIEIGEFMAGVPEVQKTSLLGPCKRGRFCVEWNDKRYCVAWGEEAEKQETNSPQAVSPK